jgi:hypothetical protein
MIFVAMPQIFSPLTHSLHQHRQTKNETNKQPNAPHNKPTMKTSTILLSLHSSLVLTTASPIQPSEPTTTVTVTVTVTPTYPPHTHDYPRTTLITGTRTTSPPTTLLTHLARDTPDPTTEDRRYCLGNCDMEVLEDGVLR